MTKRSAGGPRARQAKKRRRGCCLFSTLLLVLLLVGLCGLLYLLAYQVAAAEASTPAPDDAPGLSVFLLIDHSNSMYDRGNGVGSDPQLLRVEAARLFISFLGVDAGTVEQEVGVINFGQDAQLLLPLTPLADEARRAEINRLLDDPPRLRWTDPNKALALAYEQLSNQTGHSRPAVVLLTDGKPEWSNQPDDQEIQAYQADTRALAQAFADRNIPLFVVLLANEATDSDPDIAQIWKPLWAEIAGEVPPGAFFEVRRSVDLLPIYHDIAVALNGDESEGVIVDTTLQDGQTIAHTVAVEAGLERLTLVIYAEDPAAQVRVTQPDGYLLEEDDAGITFGGNVGQSLQEIWAVDHPVPGLWQIELQGQGQVLVWKDQRVLPATPTPAPPSATATPLPATTPSPLPTATSLPTATPSPLPTATPTPSPVLRPVTLPAALLLDQQAVLSMVVDHGQPMHQLELSVTDPAGKVRTERLLDDGRQGDEAAADGIYALPFVADTPGIYLMDFRLLDERGLVDSWSTRLVVEAVPSWSWLAPDPEERYRIARPPVILGQWMVGDQVWIPAEASPSQVRARVLGLGEQAELVLEPDKAGWYSARMPSLQQAGTYTLLITATGQTPAGLVVEVVDARAVTFRKPLPGCLLALGVLLISGVGGGLFARLRHLRAPRLTGQLVQLTGPSLGWPGGSLDLDAVHSQEQRFGVNEVDWMMSNLPRFQLQVGEVIGDTRQVYLQVEADQEVKKNGELVRGRTPLAHGDKIQAGPYGFSYQNLFLPQAMRSDALLSGHWDSKSKLAS